MVREAYENDLDNVLKLYLDLHETSIPEQSDRLINTWAKIISDKDYHLIVAEEDGKIVSSCSLIIIPNLTRNVSSYALIENVVTNVDYRHRGLASSCLEYAQKIAEENECYKIMLITGSNNAHTHNCYKKAGFYSDGKTAYYKLLREVNWKHDL